MGSPARPKVQRVGGNCSRINRRQIKHPIETTYVAIKQQIDNPIIVLRASVHTSVARATIVVNKVVLRMALSGTFNRTLTLLNQLG